MHRNLDPHPAPSTCIEVLETRIAPARFVGLLTNNSLFLSDTASLGVLEVHPITGVGAGEQFVAIDFRPATGELFALSIQDLAGDDTGRIYTIDLNTFAATVVGDTPFSTALPEGVTYGFDFNPAVDRIRITATNDLNLRVNPITGALSGLDTALSDPADTESIPGIAYDSNFAGTSAATVFGIDFQNDRLVRIGGTDGNPTPNGGVVTGIGALGVTTQSSDVGFDIRTTPDGEQAFASLLVGGIYRLYSVNLSTGAATLLGPIGNGTTTIRDISFPVAAMRIVNETTATYIDADGDIVTIKSSKGTFDSSDFSLLVPIEGGVMGGGILTGVKIGDDESSPGVKAFHGASLTFYAKRGPLGGDGLMSVGTINAFGIGLSKLAVDGDLGRIFVGQGLVDTVVTTAVGSLIVHSFNAEGVGAASTISGHIKQLKVATDFGARLVGATANGVLGSVIIGGSLIGGRDTHSGRIEYASIGTVKILGDLRAGFQDESGKILATSGNIGSITIGGGMFGALDGINDNSGQIDSANDIGAISIKRNVVGYDSSRSAEIQVGGKIGTVKIGGSLVGGGGTFSASINATGGISSILVGGSILGGSGDESTKVYSGGVIKSFTILGSILGGQGDYNTDAGKLGHVYASSMGSFSVKGSLVGDAGASSGLLRAIGGISKISIGGSIIGGSGNAAGFIATAEVKSLLIGGELIGGTDTLTGSISGTTIGTLKIGGSIIGGSGDGSGTISASGPIANLNVGGDIRGGNVAFAIAGAVRAVSFGTITVGGDLLASIDQSINTNSTLIGANTQIGSLTIRGSIVGNETNSAVIYAGGAITPVPAKNLDVAIGKLTVLGSVHRGDILSGYVAAVDPAPINGDAQIGAVNVKGNWTASNLVAGSTRGPDGKFGTGDEIPGPDNDPQITARIASIVIGGRVSGTSDLGDHFGFVSGRIGSLKVAGTTFPFTADPLQLFDVGSTGDVSVFLHN